MYFNISTILSCFKVNYVKTVCRKAFSSLFIDFFVYKQAISRKSFCEGFIRHSLHICEHTIIVICYVETVNNEGVSIT